MQPYVLRSWEAEFPDLGVAKTQGGPRVYRRADVERVLRIKHLLFVEGLTLAGARRKLQDEQPARRRRMRRRSTTCCRATRASGSCRVRQSLRELAAMLAQKPGAANGGVHARRADGVEAPRRERAKAAGAKRGEARAKKKSEIGDSGNVVDLVNVDQFPRLRHRQISKSI